MCMPRNFHLLYLFFIVLLAGCQPSIQVDLIVHNGVIYTVDSLFTQQQAFAVKDGKFLAIGTSEDILSHDKADSVVDAKGQPVYPGFYDPHSHFMGLGSKLDAADLVGTVSYQDVVDRLKVFRAENPDRAWLLGRGWDQNDWPEKSFPDKTLLDEAFPDVPVLLTRIDGHASLVNSKALQLAKVTTASKVEGGLVEIKDGKITGILVDNASRLVTKVIPPYSTLLFLGSDNEIVAFLPIETGT